MREQDEALRRLREGNRRFVVNRRDGSVDVGAARRATLVQSQSPFAVVLGCSDSRVPAEIVFDQGLGDLFVIRVAGNIVAPSQLGSVEFAVEQLGTRLVVVMGHSECGAVRATISAVRDRVARSGSVVSIIDRIRPVVEPLLSSAPPGGDAELMSACVRQNVEASTRQVREGTETIQRLIAAKQLRVVGATYDLSSGVVHFHDDDQVI